jgi:acyl-CoA dehydrogenase
MSFSLALTPEHHALVERTHRFAEEVVRPAAARHDRDESFPWEVLEAAAEAGFYNPSHYAQMHQDPTGLSTPLFLEELFWGCAGIGLAVVMPSLALAALAQAGTTEQLFRWAPECFGEPGALKTAGLAVTEPGGGSDIAALRTSARRDGGDWVLDGHKIFIGNGGIADVLVVNATVDPDAGHRGQALFVVPGGTPGLETVRKLSKLGCRASHTGEVRLDGVRVPAEHLLGGEERLRERIAKGRRLVAAEAAAEAAAVAAVGGTAVVAGNGASAAHPGDRATEDGAGPEPADGDRFRNRGTSATLGAFEATRPFVAAQAIGVARAALEYARDYACRRVTFGKPIIEHQGVGFALADVAAEIDAARLLTWRAAWMAANGVPFRHAEGSMAKLKASEAVVRATEQAVQTLGGWGYITDHPVEKWYRDAKVYTIFEGTSEIQRLLIGRALATQAGEAPLHHHAASPDRRGAAV